MDSVTCIEQMCEYYIMCVSHRPGEKISEPWEDYEDVM